MDNRASPSSSPAGADEINPERNREWHLRAAGLAEDSAKKYEAYVSRYPTARACLANKPRAADARKIFRLSMLGYLQLKDYHEQMAAENALNEKAKDMYLAAQEHKDEAARMK